MSGVELGLAVVATIDLAITHGKKLVEVCRASRNAEQEVNELTVRIEIHWVRTITQLEFLRRIWNRLGTDHQIVQQKMLEILISKLSLAESKVSKLMARNSETSRTAVSQHFGSALNKLRYASRKEDLDKAIGDLEDWSRTFDPSWFATLISADSIIDVALNASRNGPSTQLLDSVRKIRNLGTGTTNSSKSVFLPETELSSGHISNVPLSSCQIFQRAGSRKLLILNSISVPVSSEQTDKDVRELAVRLSQADPVDFGLLCCRGVIRRQATSFDINNFPRTDFTIVFRTMDGHPSIRSFRAWLHDGAAKHSLTERLDIAKQMARSISSVHTFGFVHKNIRPENILLCAPTASLLGRAFLVGFEDFRSINGLSLRQNDAAWEKELYRHPGRQGITARDTYVMQHDIYSLGVCLLELGLWETLVIYDNEGQCVLSPILSQCDDRLLFSDSPELFKQPLLSLAQNVLSMRMGTKFARVVETCLTCLDEDSPDFGPIFHVQSSRDSSVGMRYIEKVLLQLDEISM